MLSENEPKERTGQDLLLSIRLVGMPEEESGEPQAGQNPNKTHSRIGDLIKRAARSRMADHVGRVAAALGLLGGAAAPTAIDAARVFAEGSSNRVEAQEATSELQRRFSKISVSKEEAMKNPLRPLAFTVAPSMDGIGSEIYMVLDPVPGQEELRLVRSLPDAAGVSQPWEVIKIPSQQLDNILDVAAWDGNLVMVGQLNGNAAAISSKDRGQTFSAVPIPEDIANDSIIKGVVEAGGTGYDFMDVTNYNSNKSILIHNPQENKVTPITSPGDANLSSPAVGRVSTQGGLAVNLVATASQSGGNGDARGVWKLTADVSRGAIYDSVVYAVEKGRFDSADIDKNSRTNVPEKIVAIHTMNRTAVEINYNTGEILNEGKEYMGDILKGKYPNSTFGPSGYVDISDNYDVYRGGISQEGNKKSILLFIEKGTGKVIDYILDPDYPYNEGLLAADSVPFEGKKHVVAVGTELVRVFEWNDTGIPQENIPGMAHLGIKDEVPVTSTATATSTSTSFPTSTQTSTATATPTPTPTGTPTPVETSVTPTVTPSTSPTESPKDPTGTSTATSTATPAGTTVGGEQKGRIYMPLTAKNRQGS